MHAYDYPTHLPRLDYWYWYLVVAHSCALLLSGELEPTRQDELSNVRMHIDNTKESSIEVKCELAHGSDDEERRDSEAKLK